MKIKNYNKYETGTDEITLEYAEQTFQELLAFQGYGFCKSHATSYSVYSAVQMWLQEHYFLEYMCALLSHIDRAKEKKDTLVLNERVEYCVKHGTYIYYPDVNESGYKWQIKAGGLLAPLKNIKGFTDKDVNIISDNRPYNDLREFLDKTKFNNKKFETLLFANAFNKWGKVEDLYNWYYNHYFEKDKKKKKVSATDDLFAQFGFDDGSQVDDSSSESETIKTFTKAELYDKCLDLNGFVVPDNIAIRFYYVYNCHMHEMTKSLEEDSRMGKYRIYKLEDLPNLKRGENSDVVFALGQIKSISPDIKSKYGFYKKIIISDGNTSITVNYSGHLNSKIKKGNVLIIPFYIKTDEVTKENKIRISNKTFDIVDVPVLEKGDD